MRSLQVALAFVLLAGGGCRRVSGVAQVLNGVTPNDDLRSATPPEPLPDGDWAVSPDLIEVEFQEIRFVAESGNERRIDLIDCISTYDRSAPTLSQRLGCDFNLAPGSYTQLGIDFEPPLQVLIDDPINRLYTDGAGLTRSPPPGGASFSTLDVPEGGMRIQLGEPLVVDEEPIEIKIVLTAIHTVDVRVQGESAEFMGGFGVQVFATPDPVGGVAFYSAASTAHTISRSLEGGPTELYLVYEDATTPSYLFLFPGDAHRPCFGQDSRSEAFAASPGELNKDGQTMGGYLGLDDTGTLCFALPKDPAYLEYQAIYRMPEVALVGAQTTLSCEVSSTAPAPESGPTWSSGCPEITPTGEGILSLLAN